MTNIYTKYGKMALVLGIMIPIIAVLCILGASQKIFAVAADEDGKITGQIDWAEDIEGSAYSDVSLTVLCTKEGSDPLSQTSQTLSTSTGWDFTFSGLTAGGNYTIGLDETSIEAIAGKGWQYEVEGSTISISPASESEETVNIEGTITWDDAENQDGIRPESVEVTLSGGEETKTVTVTADANGDWKYSFTDLPGYKQGEEEVEEIAYTVAIADDDLPEGYTSGVTGDAENGFTITLSHTPEEITVSGTIAWDDAENQDGIRPAEVTVTLIADEEDTNDTLTARANAEWKCTFKELPKYKAGSEIAYTVAIADDDLPEGYTSEVTGDAENGFTITLSHTPEEITVSGTITWDDANDQDGKRPESVEVTLSGGEETKTVTVTAADSWTYSFTGLPKYKAGSEMTYTVQMAAIEDYTVAPVVESYDFTATHTPEEITVSGTIAWDDANDQDEIRPETAGIELKVLANGAETEYTAAIEDKKDNTWTYKFANLPKNVAGQPITYTVQMADVYGYTIGREDVLTFTAKHKAGKVNFDINAVFDDTNNPKAIRPENIQVKLYADGKETGKVLTLNAANEWKGTFEDLIQFNGQTEIVYTISLEKLDNFEYTIEKGTINLKYNNQETSDTPSETSDSNLDDTSDDTSEVSSDDISSESSDASKTGEGANTSLILALIAMFICLNVIYVMNAKKNSGKHFAKK